MIELELSFLPHLASGMDKPMHSINTTEEIERGEPVFRSSGLGRWLDVARATQAVWGHHALTIHAHTSPFASLSHGEWVALLLDSRVLHWGDHIVHLPQEKVLLLPIQQVLPC